MTFHVKTTVFEGPLDLLLQLISKHQVDVTAIGLSDVVGEYLAFVDEMNELDLHTVSNWGMNQWRCYEATTDSRRPST